METINKDTIQTLSMTRGDTIPYHFQRKDNAGKPILTEAEKIYFTVKDTDLQQPVVLQKTIEDMTFDETGTYHFTIYPEDTNNLTYGTYTYDVEVRIESDNYTRTISKGIFELTDESTWASNEV